MTKKVYFEPAGYVDQSQRELFDFPPEGYEFIVPRINRLDEAVTSDFFLSRLYGFFAWELPFNQLPLHLLKARLDSGWKRPPAGSVLTYSYNHIVFRKEPWLCQMEHLPLLLGRQASLLRRWRGVIERSFRSPWCRGIICWGEAGRRQIVANLDASGFEHKIEIVPLAVRPRTIPPRVRDDGAVRILFVGTGNTPAGFDLKGGKEVIEAFRLLGGQYPNLELVMRSDMPEEWKRRCRAMPNVRLIERKIPWRALERLYADSDIFLNAALFPGYHVAVLDAMSYGLAVVTTAYGDSRERVRDGENGLLVDTSPGLPEFGEGYLPARLTNLRGDWDRANRRVDERIVRGLVEKTRLLIEDGDLRLRLATTGRHDVEQGRLSIAARNAKLKRIFDEAVGERQVTSGGAGFTTRQVS